jgi:hypothetical protein
MERNRKRRDHLLSKQPINWAYLDLIQPLPWQTNVFTVTNPFVYRATRREQMPDQPQLYTGQVRPREDDHFTLHPPDQVQRTGPPPPPPSYNIPINLAGTLTGLPGLGDNRNPMIRHPPYRGPDGRLFYHGSTLPQTIHMPLSGQQAQRPTYGAAAEA